MNYTFPANEKHPGFTVDVPIRNWIPNESMLVAFSLFQGSLFVNYVNQADPKLFSACVLGWIRQPFPLCCGLDIVYNLHTTPYYSEEIMEKWWAWMAGISPRLRPAIGIIPRYLNTDSKMTPEDTMYKWYASKGTQWGDPIKNINYPNHVLVPYLFFPHKGIEQILKPTYGLFPTL